MYRERMNRYYPQVILAIEEFKAIIDADYPEFEELNTTGETALGDAYLYTMSESRIEEWERVLSITPIEGSSLQDRRETIIARIKGQGKLNTSLIDSIVNTFTGGTAESRIENGVLYVEITPPPENKSFQFDNVEQELRLRIPAHLGFNVRRNYQSWGELAEKTTSWKEVRAVYKNWNDVIYDKKSIVNELNVTTLENFYLG